jgi:predicted Zn-dependent protease with MMP-like domain
MPSRAEARLTQLRERAARVIEKTLAELPPPLAVEAGKVPCLLEAISAEDPDLLGLYENFAPDEVSAARGPIILYLLAIEDYCRDEDLDFEDEVRLTFLHELGHHLGWNEGELEERGLG